MGPKDGAGQGAYDLVAIRDDINGFNRKMPIRQDEK
jgi:hypothetical protein